VSLPGITGMHGLVGAVAANPAGAFTPASLFSGGVKGGYWDPSDINTLWKDTAGTTPVTADGDLVARIDDKSGNGNHLTEIVDWRPVYKTSGGLRWLQMDDTQPHFMSLTVDFPATFGTTWSRVSGLASLLDGDFGHFYSDHGTGSTDIALQANSGGGNFIFINNGTSGGPQLSFSTGSGACVITELWANPAPCQLAIDNGAYGNSPSIAATAPRGLSVGFSNTGGFHKKMTWYGAAMIDRALTGTEVANLRTFFGTKVGKSL
jgi:hypothetical protein